MKVLAADGVSAKGIDLMREAGLEVDVRDKISADELLAAIGDYDALIVRSASKVTKDVLAAGKNLKIIGRAGVGVDNIDVPEATARGIIVINSPGGNTIAATEHTMGMMIAMARHIAIYLIRTITNLSLNNIGVYFEGRDHATILASIKKIENSINTDRELSGTIRDITSNIHSRQR